MPEHTAAEREKKRQGKSAAAIAALESAEQSKPKPKPKPAVKTKEKVGTGDESKRREFTAAVVKKIRIKFEKATRAGNTQKANELRNRIKAVIAAGQ